jgi:FkbM family methyltransferase
MPGVSVDERERFFDEAAEFTSMVATTAGGATFLVSTNDEVVGRTLFVKQSRGEISLLARTVALLRHLGLEERCVTGRTLLDIGANVGTTTIPALRSFPFAAAVACEPEPANYHLLRQNVVLNDLERRVRALPVAVSSSNGTIKLAVHESNSGAHQVVSGAGPPVGGVDAPGSVRITVERVTVDFLVERGIIDADEVGLVWADVQGHEGHVLKGARSMTHRGVPVLLEFYPALLERAGGLTSLRSILLKRYSHFVDMRHVSGDAELSYDLRPTAELETFASGFPSEGAGRFTEILTVRLS